MKTSWFVSTAGIRFSRAVAVAAGSASFLMYALPNTLLTETYKDVTQLYKDGRPVRLPAGIKSLAEETMDELQWSKTKQKLTKLYTSYGFDLFHAGSFVLSAKAVLGIPKNFAYRGSTDFDREGVLVNNEPVAWSTPAGKALEESLVFSNEAKKFAVARELVHMETSLPFGYGLFSATVIMTCYIIASNLNKKWNLHNKAKGIRMVMYGLVSFISCCTWTWITDVACVSTEASVDETVANINENYARGGLEFYEKILQRNIALRTLMGEEGQNLFTAYGNDQVLFRTKHIPYTIRRDCMKARVEDYKLAVEESSAVKLNAKE